MPTTTNQTDVTACGITIVPECGMGDGETGYHVPMHVIYCEVCMEDGQHVRLRRWPVDHDSGALPGSPDRG